MNIYLWTSLFFVLLFVDGYVCVKLYKRLSREDNEHREL